VTIEQGKMPAFGGMMEDMARPLLKSLASLP